MSTPENNNMEVDSDVVKAADENDESTSLTKENVPEPDSFEISNLGRVIAGQLPFIAFDQNSKYQPVAGRWRGEIIVLNDTNPSVAPQYMELTEKPTKSETAKPSNEEDTELPPVIPIPKNI